MTRPIHSDTKIVVLLRDDLAPWQELNVTAFLVSGIASTDPAIVGEPYHDRDANTYLPMFRQPVLILTANATTLALAHERALDLGLPIALFTDELFTTNNDLDNRAAVQSVPCDQLSLVGVALHGPKNAVDKIAKGARLHA